MKLSILNLAPVREGQTYLQAVESMVNLAKHAENIEMCIRDRHRRGVRTTFIYS